MFFLACLLTPFKSPLSRVHSTMSLKRWVQCMACLAIASLSISIISSSCRFWTVVFYSWNLLVGATLFKKAYGSVVSNQIRMKFDRIVLQVNVHSLQEPDFWSYVKDGGHDIIPCTKVLPSDLCTCSICLASAGTSVYSFWCIVHSYLLTYLYIL